MTKTLKNTALIVAIAFLAFCAMVGAGLMYAVATAPPAHAGGTRVPLPPPNPVTVEMQQALTKEVNAFTTCLGTRIFDARKDNPAVGRMEEANNKAGWAAANRDLAEWNKQAGIVRTELKALNTTYGCAPAPAASPALRR